MLTVRNLSVQYGAARALQVADRAYVLEAGWICAAGAALEIAAPRVMSAYLGPAPATV